MQMPVYEVQVPGSGPYTVQLPTAPGASGYALVSVEGAGGAAIAGFSVSSGGLLTCPSGEAGATVWVTYTATVATSAQPVLGLGTKIYIATSQAVAPSISAGTVTGGTEINGLSDIEPPQPKWGKDKVTPLNSANGIERYLKTLIEGGAFKLTGFWESADPGQAALYAAYLTPSNSPNGSVYPFLLVANKNQHAGQSVQGDSQVVGCHVTEFAWGKAEPGKPIPFTCSLEVDGSVDPVYTQGS
jgi:hypothetical protein